jgi:putative protease
MFKYPNKSEFYSDNHSKNKNPFIPKSFNANLCPMNDIKNTPDDKHQTVTHRPMILAPAGNRASFLTAIGAGADAIYCGLKNFSARMEADNFSTEELSALTNLAHAKGVKVFITLNSMLKQDDVEKAAHLVEKLVRHVKPDALIVADPAFARIAQRTGFKGELHLSTLANMSFPKGLALFAEKLGFRRFVVPRELTIDEIKLMADACPEGVDLEVFVHGALCYGVSGRCYWSSFFGGKSGLRGRCVQPCRRVYNQNKDKARYFSCQDLSLDVLSRTLLTVPKVGAWKIEGRKKGPHYVYYTVKAYQLLRDHGTDPQMKKTAIGLLGQALGRPGTHYNFLPQRPWNPVDTDKQTGSGLFVGTMKGPLSNPFINPAIGLLPGDLLRIGYEDADGHAIQKVHTSIPKRGTLHLKFQEGRKPSKESPVFLIDRREKELQTLIKSLEAELGTLPPETVTASRISLDDLTGKNKKRRTAKQTVTDIRVLRKTPQRIHHGDAVWLTAENLEKIPAKLTSGCWFFLPPVIWPSDEPAWQDLIECALKKGGRRFVLNAPHQIGFFDRPGNLELWAGPFCNTANSVTVDILATLGFSGVFASPELSRADFLALGEKSLLPVGVVLSGNMPLVIARTLTDKLKPLTPFSSPKGEDAFSVKYGEDIWTYPNWKLDLTEKKDELIRAGYSLFAHLDEQFPGHITMRERPGKWNWDLTLL